ncbi:ABC transporter ATP-binding protein [Paenactinomyces guangxiensis]|uniref:ABC transporter ATP-binding protein n=1 Tax=Paenactinomyces guangxiensis TaxID=1490290 RepID=A0A7W1WRR8_9BACL|nr:ABC transporter ATP-binding protein [Paenactinomyces guangxiensis]MBA4494666.1 ABC transporter ATP-binding protein [Paenactinomyces guangxiensis]MBH8591750.1 ABC transporter ATP-binding protein [Paenactinomyces guangxiensis]
MQNSLIDVQNLRVSFLDAGTEIPVVQEVSFSVKPGEVLCIVGESGCGKSLTSLSMMGLLPSSARTSGEIKFNGANLLKLDQEELRKIRGNQISMIFQEPMTSLNPVFTVGFQLMEPLLIHRRCSKKEAYQEAIQLLAQVGISDPQKRMEQYPHELSGGMRQRVMIAMALACQPKLLIADEPTTALDVTIQAQILDLILKLRDDTGMGVILITHDMGVVAETADRVLVMYAGKAVEEGDVETLFNHPKHPYTRGLLRSVPNVDEEEYQLESIPGSLPKPGSIRQGCPFHPRCSEAMDRCVTEFPGEFVYEKGHMVRCWLGEKEVGCSHE